MNAVTFDPCPCCRPARGGLRAEAVDRPSITEAEWNALYDKVCNWGRWGPDDQRGTLNLISGGEVARAAGLVREGRSVSMSRNFPVAPAPNNPTPAQHFMIRAGDDCAPAGVGMQATSDYIGIAFHGLACSHVDALCHVLQDDRMYNGRPGSEVKSTGAVTHSIITMKDGVVGRGVLLDVPRALEIDFVAPGDFLTVADLEAAERAQGVSVGRGDILTVRTGRDRVPDPEPWRLAGLDPRVGAWLHERGVALLGGDGPNDALPLGLTGRGSLHVLALVGMGMHLMDNLWLEDVAAACAELQRWEFQMVVAPLRVEKGTGSPVNPIAIF